MPPNAALKDAQLTMPAAGLPALAQLAIEAARVFEQAAKTE